MPHDFDKDGCLYTGGRAERVRFVEVTRCRRHDGWLLVQVVHRPGEAPRLGLRTLDFAGTTHMRLELDVSEFSPLASGMRATREASGCPR